MKQEEWIDGIMHSLDGQQMADANPFLHTRVFAQMKQENASAIPLKWIYVFSGCLAVLLLLNIGLFTIRKQTADKSSIENVINEYGLKDNEFISVIQ